MHFSLLNVLVLNQAGGLLALTLQERPPVAECGSSSKVAQKNKALLANRMYSYIVERDGLPKLCTIFGDMDVEKKDEGNRVCAAKKRAMEQRSLEKLGGHLGKSPFYEIVYKYTA